MKLHNKILLGLVLGATFGVASYYLFPGADWLIWLNDNVFNPVGQIFLRMLLMVVIPLVFASITLGVVGLGDIRHVGRVGAKTIGYFLLSTLLAAALGLVLVNVVQPGGGMDPAVRQQLFDTYRSQAEGLQSGAAQGFGVQTFVNIVPRNPVDAAARMDMLAVIFFALMVGAALTTMPAERSRTFISFLEGLNDIVIRIIDFAMALAPYGVFGLIFYTTSRFGWDLLQQLGVYVIVVIVGLALHGLGTLSLLVKVLGGMNPLVFWTKARASIVTAFSTSSSSATIPTNLSVAEREMGVPPKVAGFVIPLGATMNMNGTGLYEGVTVLFLAQVFGVELSLLQQLVVVFLSVLMAIGAAGVPGGSLPLMMVVLGTVGVPPESIAIILGVDRILDMSRTVLNVTGDLSAAVFVARTEEGRSPQNA